MDFFTLISIVWDLSGGPILRWMDHHVLVPIKVFMKGTERRKFIFETTMSIKRKLTIREVLSCISTQHELNKTNDPDYYKGVFEKEKVVFQVHFHLNPEYKKITTGDAKDYLSLQVNTVTLEFICNTPLREVNSNCNIIKGEIDLLRDAFIKKAKNEVEVLHNKIIFEMKDGLKFRPIEHFNGVEEVDIRQKSCRITVSKSRCILFSDTWIMSSETQNKIIELLTFLGK